MTMPNAETLEREKDKLYLTDAEMLRRIGVPPKLVKPLLPALEAKHAFPKKSAFFGDRRYWPAVKSWLDKHEGLTLLDAASKRGSRYE